MQMKPMKGYVTTFQSVTGKAPAELEQVLGFSPGTLRGGYDTFALFDPVSINEFDWRDRTRYSGGWHSDPTVKFGSDPSTVWLVQRRDELRAALGKLNNYDERATDAAIFRIMSAEMAKLNVRSGPGRIVRVEPRQRQPGFPDSPFRSIPQWELKVLKKFIPI